MLKREDVGGKGKEKDQWEAIKKVQVWESLPGQHHSFALDVCGALRGGNTKAW